MRKRHTDTARLISFTALIGAAMALQGCGFMKAAVSPEAAMAVALAGVPQVDAFLPTNSELPAGDPLAIDGVWTIEAIDKRVRVEGGRAYAKDLWLHGLTLRIRPNMVILKDIQPDGAGKFVGEDLVMFGRNELVLQADGSIMSTVLGFKFRWVPSGVDDPKAFANLMQEAGFVPIEPTALEP